MPEARLTVWGEAECRRLHEATLELLADTGVDVRYEPALRALPRRRRVGGRPPRAHPGAPRGRCPGERAARVGCSSRAAATPRRSSCVTARSTTAPAPTCCTCATRRAASAAGSAAPTSRAWRRSARRCPNIDFIMCMGLPEDAPQEIDDLVQVVADAAGHAQAAARGAARRLRARAHAGDGGALRREGELRHLRHAVAAAHARPRRADQGHRLRRAAHPAHLRAGAQHGSRPGRAASPAPCSSATPRP